MAETWPCEVGVGKESRFSPTIMWGFWGWGLNSGLQARRQVPYALRQLAS